MILLSLIIEKFEGIFLDKYKTADIAPSIPILLRALDDPVKNSVIKSLEICKEIFLTFEEKE